MGSTHDSGEWVCPGCYFAFPHRCERDDLAIDYHKRVCKLYGPRVHPALSPPQVVDQDVPTMSHRGLTKLTEECGELLVECAKKISFPETNIHPDGKGDLIERIEDEIADVLAAIRLVKRNYQLDEARIEQRAAKKFALFCTWDQAPPISNRPTEGSNGTSKV